MPFVVQCPFCAFEARVADRANGAVGRCPKCGRTYTLARADDRPAPEADDADAADPEPLDPASADAAPGSGPTAFQPAAAAGALALLLSGAALTLASVSWLRGLVIPLGVVALLSGLAGIALARLSARPRLLLPGAGVAAALVLLFVVLLFPSLFWRGNRQTREPVAAGLQAIPLLGAPALDGAPEWVDAKRYALRRDGMRVQVLSVSLFRPPPDDLNPEPPPRLLVRVRIKLEQGDTRRLQRKPQPIPTLTDDAGRPCVLQKTEFLDRSDVKAKAAVFPEPTIEETFAFDAPAHETKTLRLELPAERWNQTGFFRFTVAFPNRPGPIDKKK